MTAAVKTRREKFTEVYHKNVWNGTESLSGTGSDHAQTAHLRQLLPMLIQELEAKSIIDAPCGDMHWMKHVPWETMGVRYTGIDIVPDLVDRMRKEYPARRFECLDLVTDILPRADVIFCRDCLVHLPLAEIRAAVANFIHSGASWLITTTFPRTGTNTEVKWSGWRPLNLEAAPLHFPQAIRTIEEGCTEDAGKYADKSIGVWRLSDLRGVVREAIKSED
jgi:SAM-dependent methyltransferase